MGQPYRESREEGNSRESLPFPRSRKGIIPGLSLPFPAPSSREGKRREGNLYPIPQRNINKRPLYPILKDKINNFFYLLYSKLL